MILHKILLGVSLAAPVGPVTVEMIKRGLNYGFFSAFAIRLGGVIGNFACLLAAYFGLSQLLGYPAVLNSLGLIGAVFLIYMGSKTVCRAIFRPIVFSTNTSTNTNTNAESDFQTQPSYQNALSFGFVLAVANPIALMFWVGQFANTLQEQVHTFSNSPGLLLGLGYNLFILMGVLLWGACLSGALAWGRNWITQKTINQISGLAGIMLIGYGIRSILTVIDKL